MLSYTGKRPFPRDIQEKIRLLKSHKETLELLEERMAVTKQECNRLERELELYQASVAPVRQIPRELLVIVFQHYLSDNPRLVRRLLLVSRQWYSIATTEPRLWTNIPIIFDNRKEHAKHVADSITPRIDACLKHSASLPLHLDINLENLTSAYNLINGCVGALARSMGTTIDLSGSIWANPTTAPIGQTWDPVHAIDFLRDIVCRGGEAMKRWKTAILVLPSDIEIQISKGILQNFTGPTPYLTSLRVEHLPWPVVTGPMFPDLSSLKMLAINQPPRTYDIPIPYDSVEHLSIESQDAMNLHRYQLQLYTSLVSLEIRTPKSCGFPNSSPTTVNLPSLQRLAFIEQGYGSMEGITFILPRLEILHIERANLRYSTEMPNVDPKSLAWYLNGSPEQGSDKGEIRNALRDVILLYSRIESLTVSEVVKDSLLEVVAELKREFRMPSSLRFLRIEGYLCVKEIDLHSTSDPTTV